MSKHIFDDVKTYELFYKIGSLLITEGVHYSVSHTKFDFTSTLGSFLKGESDGTGNSWVARGLTIWLISDTNYLRVVRGLMGGVTYVEYNDQITIGELVRKAITPAYAREELLHTVLVYRTIQVQDREEVCVYLYKISEASQHVIQQIARKKQSASDKKQNLSEHVNRLQKEMEGISDDTSEIVFQEEREGEFERY